MLSHRSGNVIEDISQTNTATGSESANVDQENRLDSEDPDVPGINQVITSDNTCDETGTGDNSADCENEGPNEVDDVNQANTVDDASGTSNVFQDNVGVISQVIEEANDCDESSTGLNDVFCNNDIYENQIDGLDQSNTVGVATDDAFVSQDNIADLSQVADEDNNCDETGTGDNTAFCENFNQRVDVNEIADIVQTNVVDSASGDRRRRTRQ